MRPEPATAAERLFLASPHRAEARALARTHRVHRPRGVHVLPAHGHQEDHVRNQLRGRGSRRHQDGRAGQVVRTPAPINAALLAAPSSPPGTRVSLRGTGCSTAASGPVGRLGRSTWRRWAATATRFSASRPSLPRTCSRCSCSSATGAMLPPLPHASVCMQPLPPFSILTRDPSAARQDHQGHQEERPQVCREAQLVRVQGDAHYLESFFCYSYINFFPSPPSLYSFSASRRPMLARPTITLGPLPIQRNARSLRATRTPEPLPPPPRGKRRRHPSSPPPIPPSPPSLRGLAAAAASPVLRI